MSPSRRRRPHRSIAALAGMILLAVILRLAGLESSSLTSFLPPGATPARSSERAPREIEGSRRAEPGDAAARRLARAFAEGESGFMVTFEGEVSRILADDRDGSRHQRFLVRVEGGDQTLLVAHNIDLAERVPVARGDRVRLRGQYEWNDRGGVLHWTHHDPDGRHPGGFVERAGRRFE